jgi:cobalamin synthase
VGSAAVATLALTLLAEVGALAGLADSAGVTAAALACVAAAATSRAAAPLAAVLLPARGTGLGQWFSAEVRRRDALAAAVSALTIAALGGAATSAPMPLFAAIGGLLVGLGFAAWLAGRRGGLDGDGFGAVVELTFVSVLLLGGILA